MLTGPASHGAAGGKVRLGVRPERIALSPQPTQGQNIVPGTVTQVVFKGAAADVYVEHRGRPLRAQIATGAGGAHGITPGATVWAAFDREDVLVFPDGR
jgi:ABC-type molybdate transport system ATPase subunit